jgi:hypothetical protein
MGKQALSLIIRGRAQSNLSHLLTKFNDIFYNISGRSVFIYNGTTRFFLVPSAALVSLGIKKK